MRCDLQIFSGCVCHLEQLHAQSPVLFPIVFSINNNTSLTRESLVRDGLPGERGQRRKAFRMAVLASRQHDDVYGVVNSDVVQ